MLRTGVTTRRYSQQVLGYQYLVFSILKIEKIVDAYWKYLTLDYDIINNVCEDYDESSSDESEIETDYDEEELRYME